MQILCNDESYNIIDSSKIPKEYLNSQLFKCQDFNDMNIKLKNYINRNPEIVELRGLIHFLEQQSIIVILDEYSNFNKNVKNYQDIKNIIKMYNYWCVNQLYLFL